MQSMHALPKAVLHVLRPAKVRFDTPGATSARRIWTPGLPKGSKILEKAAMLAADCRTAGLEGLEDWRLGI